MNPQWLQRLLVSVVLNAYCFPLIFGIMLSIGSAPHAAVLIATISVMIVQAGILLGLWTSGILQPFQPVTAYKRDTDYGFRNRNGQSRN